MKAKQNLMTASRQWQYRPADERYWTLEELLRRTKKYADESVTKNVALIDCKVQPFGDEDNDLQLVGPSGNGAQFQHYSFGQFSNLCSAPANYLRTLPAPLAAECLNTGLEKLEGKEHSLLFHKNGGLHLRAVTSDAYARIWNYEVAELALALQEGEGWVTPPARPCGQEGVPVRIATEADVLKHSAHAGLGVKVGDEISPAGLYASDHDCFIFQVNEDVQVDAGDGELLYRGVFWQNSEVGAARFRGTMFLYETCCSNHICWNSTVVAEISIRHTGNARQMFAEAMATVTARMARNASEDEHRITACKRYELGPSQEKIVQLIYGKQWGLTKTQCEDAYRLAEIHEDDHGGNPRSAWGYAAGITRLSQQGGYADKRDVMDRAAGKVLALAF